MGRWGYMMFQGDMDLDLKIEIEEDIAKLSGITGLDFFEKKHQEQLRQILNGGVANQLFERYRKRKDWALGAYIVLVLGMLCMSIGADINGGAKAVLYKVKSETESHHGFAYPLMDHGFRDPGAAQFTAALEHYKNGEPRPLDPSCWACGKIAREAGLPQLLRCTRCNKVTAFYCNTECQKKDWPKHKTICPRDTALPKFMMNV